MRPIFLSAKLLFVLTLLMGTSSGAWALTPSEPALDPVWNAHVMIEVDGWDSESRDRVPAFCNATFVSPQVLVTAAHCLTDAQILGIREIEIQSGEYRYVRRRTDGATVRVGYVTQDRLKVAARFEFTPNLARQLTRGNFGIEIAPEDDVALIRLEAPWAGTIAMQFPRLLPPSKDALLNEDLGGSMKVVSINFMEETSLDTRRMADLDDISRSWGGGYLSSGSRSRVQPMDSGSGLYLVDGPDLYLVGVVKGRAENFFSSWDVYTPAVEMLRRI